jgi:hypothetical protein
MLGSIFTGSASCVWPYWFGPSLFALRQFVMNPGALRFSAGVAVPADCSVVTFGRDLWLHLEA